MSHRGTQQTMFAKCTSLRLAAVYTGLDYVLEPASVSDHIVYCRFCRGRYWVPMCFRFVPGSGLVVGWQDLIDGYAVMACQACAESEDRNLLGLLKPSRELRLHNKRSMKLQKGPVARGRTARSLVDTSNSGRTQATEDSMQYDIFNPNPMLHIKRRSL